MTEKLRIELPGNMGRKNHEKKKGLFFNISDDSYPGDVARSDRLRSRNPSQKE